MGTLKLNEKTIDDSSKKDVKRTETINVIFKEDMGFKHKTAKFLSLLVINYFEIIFMITIFLAILGINYFVQQKLTFLNLFFLPVIFGGYYLGQRFSVVGALLCVLLITLDFMLDSSKYVLNYDVKDVYIYISAWGGFLILAGAVVGRQKENLSEELNKVSSLNADLKHSDQKLKAANNELKKYMQNLELEVKERTKELEDSHASIKLLKNKVEETLYNTMDRAVVQQIISGQLRNEKREISLMFTDLTGFTTYSEGISPELVVRDLNRYLSVMEPIILKYHGHIDKFIGDGIMCEYGAPVIFNQYKLMSVLSAIEMQEKIKASHFPWKMRIGIASGPAIVGMIGAKRQNYTAIGDVVNLASRLEKIDHPGEILIDSATNEGIKNLIETVPLKNVNKNLAKKETPIEEEVKALKEKLKEAKDPVNTSLLNYQIGHLYMSLSNYTQAILHFKEASYQSNNNVEYKLAFAEATLKLEEDKTLKVRGLSKKIIAYKVVGIKDQLKDGTKIPKEFYEKYKSGLELIDYSGDDLYPVESLDGSIGHGQLVALLSYALSTELNLHDADTKDIVNAAFLADIGKQIIPQHLLNRTGPFSTNELEEIQAHPDESIRIVKQMGVDSDTIIKCIKHSHENMDGSGYPDKLEQDNIPIGSRIINISDFYASLISWRPYRDPWNYQVAMDEIAKGAENGRMDKEIVAVFKKILNSNV